MPKPMHRVSSADRVLPAVDAGLYWAKALPDDGENDAAPPVLHFPDTDYFSALQRLTGWKLPAHKRVARVLYLHRLAFRAELEGRFRRADFFWREMHVRLREIWGHAGIWEAAHVALAGKIHGDGRAFRDLLANELFIDTHVAFANGRLSSAQKLLSGDRAFVHLRFIQNLLELHELPAAQRAALLCPGIEAEIEALVQEKRWDEAMSRATELPDAAGIIHGSDGTSEGQLEAAFEEQAAGSAVLGRAPANVVGPLILKRRRQKPEQAVEPERHPAQPATGVEGAPPRIVVSARAASFDPGPLGYWLFGTQDWGLRLCIPALAGMTTWQLFRAALG